MSDGLDRTDVVLTSKEDAPASVRLGYHPRVLGRRLLRLLLGWIFAISLVMPTLPLFNLPASVLKVLVYTGLTLVMLAVATWNHWHVLVSLIALLGGGIAAFLAGYTPSVVGDWAASVFARGFTVLQQYAEDLSGAGGEVARVPKSAEVIAYQDMLTFALAVAVALLVYIVYVRAKWVWPLMLGLIVVVAAKMITGAETGFFWLAPAVLLTMLSFVRSNRVEREGEPLSLRRLLNLTLQTLIPIGLAVGLTALAVPRLDYETVHSETLRDVTHDLVSLLPQNYQDRFEIYNFSIRQAGYFPLGDRLGGPLDLNTDPLLQVSGEPGYFLKGASADLYDGKGWKNTRTNPHYRFNSVFNAGEQERVMSDKRPILEHLPEAMRDTIVATHTYGIRPLMDNIQVVFGDGVLDDAAKVGDDSFQFYFNQAGLVYGQEIFGSDTDVRAVATGFRPAIIPGMNLFDPNRASNGPTAVELDRAVKALEEDGTVLPDQEDAARYLQLPDLPAYREGGLISNTAQYQSRGARTDYEKAVQLYRFLAQNEEFRYTLDVSMPPEDMEFVSYFLMTQEGYCTYYATAYTMLLRSVGVPARYVEGFAVPPAEQRRLASGAPSVTLTAEHAHAWTEVYLGGIGWVPVDPTPGGAGGDALPVLLREEPPELSPTPPPDPDQSGTPTPTPLPEALSPSPTAAPTPTPAPADEIRDAESAAPPWLGLLLKIVGALALIVLIGWAYYRSRLARRALFHDLRRLAGRITDRDERAATYWFQLLTLLDLLPPGAAPPRLSIRALADWHLDAKDLPATLAAELRDAAAIAELAFFSDRMLTEDEMTTLALCFDHLEDYVEETLSPVTYLRRRLLKPGSFRTHRID